MTPTTHSHSKSEITDFPTSMQPTSHTHGKSDITDFPTSLPASGGNADTVGGLSPTSFAPAGFGLGSVCTTISDWNTVVATGFYASSTSASNKPVANTSFMGYAIVYNVGNIVQYVTDFNDNKKWYVRYKTNNVWSNWVDRKSVV